MMGNRKRWGLRRDRANEEPTPTAPPPPAASAPPPPGSSAPPPPSDPSEARTLIDGESGPAPPESPPAPSPEPEIPRPPEVGPELPESPVIGRVARSWRRHLAGGEWPRPSYAADGGELGDFDVLAASAIGQGHLHRRDQRQDAYHLAAAPDGTVLAIADGVSAKPLAAIGAETAAFVAVRSYLDLARLRASTRGLTSQPTAERLVGAVEEADAAMRATALELEVEPRELSTTLLLAHLAPGRSGSRVTIAAVGNSSALALLGEEPPTVVSGPRPGQRSAHGEFLPGAPEAARIAIVELRPEAVLVLATDGLAEDLHASAAVRGWLWARLSSARTPLEFAYALSYRRQGSADDLTAVAARAARRRQ